MRNLGIILPLALAAALSGPHVLRSPGASLVTEARAQDALSTCTLKGSPLLARGLQLFDVAKDGKPIAEFIGAQVPLALTIPEDPVKGRTRASLSAGKPTLRLEGWIALDTIPIYAVKDVDAVGEQVKLAGGHTVKLVKGAQAKLTAELTIAGSENQTVRGTGGCDAFSLDWARPTIYDPPQKAKPYLMKGTSLDLFDKPNGENVYTLSMAEGASPLFHSVEIRGMYHHVLSRSDVVIDAWVKLGSMNAIKKGDRIESPPTAPSRSAGARMVLDSSTPLKTASKDFPVHYRRDEKEKPIGTLEKGAQFYVTQVVAGWSNILPQELHVSPATNAGFWIKTEDGSKLRIAPPDHPEPRALSVASAQAHTRGSSAEALGNTAATGLPSTRSISAPLLPLEASGCSGAESTTAFTSSPAAPAARSVAPTSCNTPRRSGATSSSAPPSAAASSALVASLERGVKRPPAVSIRKDPWAAESSWARAARGSTAMATPAWRAAR